MALRDSAALAVFYQCSDRRVRIAAVPPASPEDLLQASLLFNGGMQRLFAGEDLPPLAMWYKLFKRLDDDGSGVMSYNEMVGMTRNVLRLDEKALPLQGLQV